MGTKIRGRWTHQRSHLMSYEQADMLSDALEDGLSVFRGRGGAYIREIYVVRYN